MTIQIHSDYSATDPLLNKKWFVIIVLLAMVTTGSYFAYRHAIIAAAPSAPAPSALAPSDIVETPSHSNAVVVNVVHPHEGEMDRTTKQPGSVQAFESVQLYAGVSGFLKAQSVDIGDRIKQGQVLAQVDVPELEKQVQRCASVVDQADARVTQAKARAVSARADFDAAKATVPRAESLLKSKTAELRYRQQQLDRMRELAALKSIEDKLVDEHTSQRDAAHEAEIAAHEGVTSAKANVAASAAKIQAADADVVESEAEVKVAKAELEKAQVLVRYATITAPFDGVVTERNFFVRDFVRAAHEGSHAPLLTVQRTDLMRVIVQIPDRDVPFCDPGDPAIIEIDALPDEKILRAKVSRVAESEDSATRLMRIEIDVPNPTRKIRNGMYGRVTIILEKSSVLSLPASCVFGRFESGKGSVFVVRDGKAVRVPVRYSDDNGIRVGIISGLKPGDHVVRQPPSGLGDDAPVVIATIDGKTAPKSGS
jgi:RND family efflux transporter MFP subunit